MELLEKKRKTLNGFTELLTMFREIESISTEMKDVEVLSYWYIKQVYIMYMRCAVKLS